MTTIFCQQYKFIIKDVICNIVLHTISTIIGIQTCNPVFGSNRNSSAV